MAHLSVIVTDGGPVAQQVQEVAADWARAGLVGESAWVSPADVTPTAGPPEVLSTVIGPDETHRADLFQTIGVRRLDTVRLVVAQFIVSGDEQAPVLTDLGRTLEELLTDTLPRPTSDESGQGTLLRRTNVFIPASGVHGVSKEALIPGWDANVVVAAEDRPDLDRASVYVRDGGNYVGHAAGAIASAAALWSGIDRGSLDILDTDSTTMETYVDVVRHAVRAIVRNNDVEELADTACKSIVGDPSAPARDADWARPAIQPGSVIDSVLAELMQTGDWAVRAPALRPKPEQTERRFGTAFSDAATFNAQLFKLGLRAIVGMGRRAVESVATDAIVGAEGDYVVRFQPSSPSSIVRQAQALLDAQSEALRNGKLIEEADSVTAPDAATWVDLRRSCFGLVDGSQLPGEYEVPENAGKPQLLPPSSIVPDPTDTFVTMDGKVIRACDAQSAAEYFAVLRAAASLRPGAKQRRPHAGGPTPDPASQSETAALPAIESDGDETMGSDGDETLAEEADVRDSPIALALDRAKAKADDASEKGTARKKERRLAMEGLAALEKWMGARRVTLVWRIYDGVAKQAAQNSAEARHAYGEATASTQLPAESLRESQRRLVAAWSILGFAFAAGSVYLWLGQYLFGQMTASNLVSAIAGLLLVVVLLGVLFNHLYYKAVRRFEWMVERTLASRRQTAEHYVVAQREANRFRLLASRLNDWAEIIGSVLHRPWTPQPAGRAQTAVETLTHLPAAVAVAVPPQKGLDVKPVVMARAIQVLTSRGWANQAFDDAIDAYESNVRSARDGGHLAAELDTLDNPTSPLALLSTFFLKGEAGTYATATARERIEKALTDGDLELPPRSVRRTGEYADGETVSDAQFFGGVLRQAIPFVRDIWTPNGLMNHKNVPNESAVWMPRVAGQSRTETITRFPATGDVAMRVDISRRCDITDLQVFKPETAEDLPPDPTQDDDF
jgi:hypothetical protein